MACLIVLTRKIKEKSPPFIINIGAFVRTHLTWLAKRRERAYYSHRASTTCAVSSWENEELDERLFALFMTSGRKSLGSC
jgi:hypothetical protein